MVFWSIKSEIKFWTEKKSKKKELDPFGSLVRRVAGTMYNVGGRVREGWPPNFGPTRDRIQETPATGAADLDGFAAIPPTPWGTKVCLHL